MTLPLAHGLTFAPADTAAPRRAPAETRADQPSNQASNRDRHGGTLRVLVIEDEVIIGMLLKRVLVGMGHEVISVEGTEQGAVAAAARVRPSLVLVDERLRAGSGQGAIERILRDGFVPHVWMSGDPGRRTQLAPGVAVLQKPFSEHALGLAIAQACAPGPTAELAGEAADGGPESKRTPG